jgi:hypothetical protein
MIEQEHAMATRKLRPVRETFKRAEPKNARTTKANAEAARNRLALEANRSFLESRVVIRDALGSLSA